MVATAPECPACGAPLRLTSDLTSAGLTKSWMCTDTTCPTIVPEEEARRLAVRDDVLGGPAEVLMQAPVTPQGGGGGNGRVRRQPKPGDREAIRARRERRYLDQDAAGGRGRGPAEERRQKKLRLSADLETWLEQASARSGLPQQGILEGLLWAAMEAPWCAVCNLPGLPGGGCIGGCRPRG